MRERASVGGTMSTEVNKILFYKSCPRCRGDMHDSRDMYGTYRVCVQCGHMVDLAEPNRLASLLTHSRKKPVASTRARRKVA